jgi:N-acetylneuraminic acid mutarotase
MRRSILPVGVAMLLAFSAVHGCSLIENFDGYTGGHHDASGIDAPQSGDDTSTGDDTGVESGGSDTSMSGPSHIYVIGGEDMTHAYTDVLVATVNSSNGSLGAWSLAGNVLPAAVSAQGAVAVPGFLYSLGGRNNAFNPVNDVLFSPLASDGTPGSWVSTNGLPTSRENVLALTTGNFLYAIGGLTSAGSLADVQLASVNTTGGLSAWTGTAMLPAPRDGAAGATANGWLYVIAGEGNFDGGVNDLSDVAAAHPDPSGNISAWQTLPQQLTGVSAARFAPSAVYASGHLYVFGGQDNAFTDLADVQYAAVNPDGSIGAWTQTQPLPSGHFGHASVAVGGYVYVIGGETFAPSFLTQVVYAPIQPDGSLGTWQLTTQLPTGRAFCGAAAF